MLLADLFLTFAKMGVMTFGGGYAMLPILQREVVEKKKWATEEELSDYFAVGQCTPGIIAVNTATFIATFGVVFPSIVIIALIAAFLSNFADIPVVRHALGGVNAAVVALIAASVIKLGKSTLKNTPSMLIYLCALTLAAAGSLLALPGLAGQVLDVVSSPVFLVLGAGCVGWLVFHRKGGEGK